MDYNIRENEMIIEVCDDDEDSSSSGATTSSSPGTTSASGEEDGGSTAFTSALDRRYKIRNDYVFFTII